MNLLPSQSLEGFWEWIDEIVKILGENFTETGVWRKGLLAQGDGGGSGPTPAAHVATLLNFSIGASISAHFGS